MSGANIFDRRKLELVDSVGASYGTDHNPLVTVPPPAGTDAFGQPIVAMPFTLFNAMQLADKNADLWHDDTSGTGAAITYSSNKASTLIQLGNGASSPDGSYARRSSRYIPYIPAHGSRFVITFSMPASDTYLVQEVGQFDSQNGIFLREKNGSLSIVLRTFTSGSMTETVIPQASWNQDAMDGSGESGVTLDITKRQIIVIDYQWLGVGKVLVGFDLGNDTGVRWAHKFDHVNETDGFPYMSSPILPITYMVRAEGGSVDTVRSMRQICASAVSFGAEKLTGFQHSVSNGASLLATTTRRPILTIRPRTKNVPVVPITAFAYSSAEPVFMELVLNGTLTGATFASSVDHVDYDVAATAISGGHVIASGYVVAASTGASRSPGVGSQDIAAKLWLSLLADETTFDHLTIVATSVTGSSTNVGCSFDYQEIL